MVMLLRSVILRAKRPRATGGGSPPRWKLVPVPIEAAIRTKPSGGESKSALHIAAAAPSAARRGAEEKGIGKAATGAAGVLYITFAFYSFCGR